MQKFKKAASKLRFLSTIKSNKKVDEKDSLTNNNPKKQLSMSGFQHADSLFKFVHNARSKATIIKKDLVIRAQLRSPDFSYQKRKFESALKNNKSDIDFGLDTFFTLSKIHKKDPTFYISVPEMIVFHCGFDQSTIINSDTKFRITTQEDVKKLKKFASNLFEQKTNPKFPALILKYKGKNRILIYTQEDLYDNFPDSSHECIIQKFILPKGLKAIKYRVIVGEFIKVYIFSNRIRLDSKKDVFENSESKLFGKGFEQPKKKVNRKNLLNSEIPGIDLSEEKNSVLNLFRIENFDQKNAVINNFEDCKPSTRFLTHEDIEKTSLFEGKNQSFDEIINLTKYLKSKIDNYALEGCKLTELGVDYLQDSNGKWHLLKIKYGKTVKVQQKKLNTAVSYGEYQRKRIMLRSINAFLNCTKLIF